MREVYYTDFSGWAADGAEKMPWVAERAKKTGAPGRQFRLSGAALKRVDLLASRLSGRRQEQIRSFRSDENRLQSLAAGLLLDYGLKRHGLTERDAQIRCSACGKPFPAAEPDLHFNLSHSGSCVLLALSDQPCGCDIQKLSRTDPRICARVLAKEEREYLERFPEGEERDGAFTELWTRKESCVKLTGEGLRRPLASFLTLPGRTPAGCVLFTWNLPGYAASACFLSESGYRSRAACTRCRLPDNTAAEPHLVFCPFQNIADVVE